MPTVFTSPQRVLECLAPFLVATARKVPAEGAAENVDASDAYQPPERYQSDTMAQQAEDDEYQFLAGFLLVPGVHVLLQGRVWCEGDYSLCLNRLMIYATTT